MTVLFDLLHLFRPANVFVRSTQHHTHTHTHSIHFAKSERRVDENMLMTKDTMMHGKHNQCNRHQHSYSTTGIGPPIVLRGTAHSHTHAHADAFGVGLIRAFSPSIYTILDYTFRADTP